MLLYQAKNSISQLYDNYLFWFISLIYFFTADGYSIYVKNLPLDATPAQLEEEFKKFGAIKSGGIQVRSHKVLFYFLFFDIISIHLPLIIWSILKN